MESERKVTRDDLIDDAIVNIECAADLLYTTEGEYFEALKQPEDWESEYTYESISRKIHVVSTILWQAINQFRIGRGSFASEYFMATAGLMGDIVHGADKQDADRKKKQ